MFKSVRRNSTAANNSNPKLTQIVSSSKCDDQQQHHGVVPALRQVGGESSSIRQQPPPPQLPLSLQLALVPVKSLPRRQSSMRHSTCFGNDATNSLLPPPALPSIFSTTPMGSSKKYVSCENVLGDHYFLTFILPQFFINDFLTISLNT